MRKITVSKILLSAFVPTVAVGACSIITSCSIKVSTPNKQPVVDTTTGKASIDLDLSEQPKNDEITVSITTTKGEHQVLLVDEGGSAYDGHPSAIYQAHNRKARAYVAFREFCGNNTSSSFDLKIKYKNSSGRDRTCSLNGCELKLNYDHKNIETDHIVDLNDFHGAAAGYGDEYFTTVSNKNPGAIRIAKAIEPILEQPGSIFLTAGDNTSGESFSTSTHAESMFPILKSMKARYSAVGNHAFEWGIDPLITHQFDKWGRTEETEGNYFITANILNGKFPSVEWEDDPTQPRFEADYQSWKGARVTWADPYKILNMNGHLVCLIGLTTDLTLNDGNREVVENLDFIKYTASIQYANRLCHDELGDDWYDAIEAFVLLTHIESAPQSSSDLPDPTSAAAKLAAELNFPKVQAIISAHSHKTVCGPIDNPTIGHSVWVGQAETAGRKFLDTQLTFDNTKEIGKRFVSAKMKVENINFTNTSYIDANNELLEIRRNPGSEYVKNVINTYDYEKDFVKNKLKSVVAHRKDALLYPASEGHIGHVYFCSDNFCDPLGAWLCLGQMTGFASYYEEDIVTKKEIDYPALSFVNIDTCNYQLPEPKPEQLDPRTGMAKVTLKELYSIQGYENPMSFGYLSILQLANIIDYLLSGNPEISPEHSFDYDKPSEYFVEGTGSDLRYNTKVKPGSKAIVCDTGEWQPTDYKGTPVKCRYNAGPLQWYGMRFEVEQAGDEERQAFGREYHLVYEEASDEIKALTNFDKVPKIWIIDPINNPNKVYQDIYNPSAWKDVSHWLREEYINKRYIPVAINSFIDTSGNAQNTMFSKYFAYNAGEYSSCSYIHYSNISREMLEELCRLTEEGKWDLHFDLSTSIVDQLVTKLN